MTRGRFSGSGELTGTPALDGDLARLAAIRTPGVIRVERSVFGLAVGSFAIRRCAILAVPTSIEIARIDPR
jgi:hypothetical protein